MKPLAKAALAASLALLAACGGGAEQNVAANNASDELYNLAPDDLVADNLVGNEVLDNISAGNEALPADQNAAGNAQ